MFIGVLLSNVFNLLNAIETNVYYDFFYTIDLLFGSTWRWYILEAKYFFTSLRNYSRDGHTQQSLSGFKQIRLFI